MILGESALPLYARGNWDLDQVDELLEFPAGIGLQYYSLAIPGYGSAAACSSVSQ